MANNHTVRAHAAAAIPLDAPYRAATPEDANAMADLVNFAGEDMPLYLWSKMTTPGQSPWDVGSERARRVQGAFSYLNTVVREEGGRVAAALIGYPLSNEPESWADDEMPAMFVPLQELEDLAAGTWYINVVAAYPEYRGRGFGTGLLEIAERLGEIRASDPKKFWKDNKKTSSV